MFKSIITFGLVVYIALSGVTYCCEHLEAIKDDVSFKTSVEMYNEQNGTNY